MNHIGRSFVLLGIVGILVAIALSTETGQHILASITASLVGAGSR